MWGKSSELQRCDWFTSNAPLVTAFGTRSGYTIVLGLKGEQRCVNVDAKYLDALLAMANYFNEQPSNIEWNEFLNANYTAGYEDPTLFSSLDYFVSHDTLEPNPRLTIFSQDLETDHPSVDRISTPVCSDQANPQGSLGGQGSRVKFGETGPEYKEIKALYGETSVVSTLLTSV